MKAVAEPALPPGVMLMITASKSMLVVFDYTRVH